MKPQLNKNHVKIHKYMHMLCTCYSRVFCFSNLFFIKHAKEITTRCIVFFIRCFLSQSLHLVWDLVFSFVFRLVLLFMLLLFLFLGQSLDLLTEHPALCCSENSISFREPNGADGEIRDASRAMFQISNCSA